MSGGSSIVQAADISAPLATDILTANGVQAANLLSDTDRDLYQHIFTAQKKADWKTADRLIKSLSDRVLMGHVLYQRYMHPRGYRSTYAELKGWLAQYADHPYADRVYKLALKRRGRSAYPRKPVSRRYREPANAAYAVGETDRPSNSRSYRRAAAQVRALLRRERPTQALGHIDQASVRRHLSRVDYDVLRQRIAGSYFIEDRDQKAYDIAADVAARNREAVPLADWYAGLAAWRMGRTAVAADHFAALARSSSVNDWTRAAGGYWAARAYLAERRPEKVAPMLEIAADTGATFYGLIAARQLGRPLNFTWIEPKLDQAGYQLLLAHEPVRRAIALVDAGRRDLAESELTRAHGRLDASLDPALIALARQLHLPATQLQVANAAFVPSSRAGGPAAKSGGGPVMNAGLFPLPAYAPEDGYRLDRALVYAVMRQESRFKPAAKSYAGARGLMQIMPATASLVAHDRSLRRSNRDKLFDPGLNLAIGQQYIEQLMGRGEPYGNLFMLVTAYNGGPGNLNRWLRNTDYRGDPLLFIESIPVPETRGYIERVLTNLWIYRDRLGQPAPSLDAAAAGLWPVYQPIETLRPLAQR